MQAGPLPSLEDLDEFYHQDTQAGFQERYPMTGSQLVAFDNILCRKLKVVWGPPGAGKSYFSAASIMRLMELHYEAGKPFLVGVVALTHTAIDSLMRKIGNMRAQADDRDVITVFKAVSIDCPNTCGRRSSQVLPHCRRPRAKQSVRRKGCRAECEWKL